MEIRATTTGAEDCAAVITFMSQHQTQQEVVESLSAAVFKAVKGATDARVMKELLEQSDMRFRLKHILGDWEDEESDDEFVFVTKRACTEPRSMDRD